jgi:hypothetical protein
MPSKNSVNNASQNIDNDLKREETSDNARIDNGNQKKNKVQSNSTINNHIRDNNSGKSITELLLQVKDSIPLPKPFTPVDPRGPPPILQRPDKDNPNWRGPVIPLSILYGLPLKESALNLGPQPFPSFFNWNKYKKK